MTPPRLEIEQPISNASAGALLAPIEVVRPRAKSRGLPRLTRVAATPEGVSEADRAAKSAENLWRAYARARRAAARSNARESVEAERCDRARNDLVEHYQALVRTLVSALLRRLPPSVDRGDLETAANVGLMSAIEAFDPTRGVPFELYAEHRLRGALLDELRSQDWLPRPWRTRLEARRRAIEKLRADLGREPWDDEVANLLGITVQLYQQDYGAALVDGPITPSFSEDDSAHRGPTLDGVPDLVREAPEENLTRVELLRLVAEKLSVQEYRLVYLKYWEDMPLREIGTVLGLSESRVCKIHLALLGRLRDKLSVDR